jgi:hypothetical protein
MDENDLESRIVKIEEYIKCCERTKGQQWKETFIVKLDDVKNDLKSEIKNNTLNTNKNITDMMKYSRQLTYALGFYVAGIIQLSLFLAICILKLVDQIQTNQTSLSFQNSDYISLIAGAFLTAIGWYFIKKVKGNKINEKK